jgi:hypothetical protein
VGSEPAKRVERKTGTAKANCAEATNSPLGEDKGLLGCLSVAPILFPGLKINRNSGRFLIVAESSAVPVGS